MKRLKAGLIGCGAIGTGYSFDKNVKSIQTHAEAFFKHPDIDFKAVCDIKKEQALKCSKKWQVNAYTNIEKLMENEELDIIAVATPDKTHYKILDILLKYPVKAVISEKPLALSINDAYNITKRYQKKGIPLIVNYIRRFDLLHQKIKKIIDISTYGNLQGIQGYYTKGLKHNGTHIINIIRYFAGDKIEAVLGIKTRKDDYNFSIKYKNNSIMVNIMSMNYKNFNILEIDLLFQNGRIRINDLGYNADIYISKKSKRYSGYKELFLKDHLKNNLNNVQYNIVHNVYQHLKNNKELLSTGEDAYRDLYICEKIITSADNNRWVKV